MGDIVQSLSINHWSNRLDVSWLRELCNAGTIPP